MCTLCLREKKQEMRLSVSMMQAFPCSYFLEKIMNSSSLGMTACQARKTVERQNKQQLGKDRLHRLPVSDRWREERRQGVMWQRWRCSVSQRKWDKKRSKKWELKKRCGNMWLLCIVRNCHPKGEQVVMEKQVRFIFSAQEWKPCCVKTVWYNAEVVLESVDGLFLWETFLLGG